MITTPHTYMNTDTLAAFGTLSVASGLSAPFDLAVGLFVILGLVFMDKTTWGRHIAVFAWMCSRIWPEFIHDSYHVSDAPILLMGVAFLVLAERVRGLSTGIRRSLEITYVVLALLPIHGPPHFVLGVAFCATCVTQWIVATAEQRQAPEGLIKSCVWILCLKTPALAVVPVFFDVWTLRKHVALPSTKRGSEVAVQAPTPAPSSSSSSQPSRPPIRSARVPPQYYSRASTLPTVQRKTEDESSELSKYTPIESDEV